MPGQWRASVAAALRIGRRGGVVCGVRRSIVIGHPGERARTPPVGHCHRRLRSHEGRKAPQGRGAFIETSSMPSARAAVQLTGGISEWTERNSPPRARERTHAPATAQGHPSCAPTHRSAHLVPRRSRPHPPTSRRLCSGRGPAAFRSLRAQPTRLRPGAPCCPGRARPVVRHPQYGRVVMCRDGRSHVRAEPRARPGDHCGSGVVFEPVLVHEWREDRATPPLGEYPCGVPRGGTTRTPRTASPKLSPRASSTPSPRSPRPRARSPCCSTPRRTRRAAANTLPCREQALRESCE